MPVLSIGLMTALMFSVPATTRGVFFDSESSSGNAFEGWTPSQWLQTSQSDFESGVLLNVDTTASPGDITLVTSTSNLYLYAFRGNGKQDFWRYDVVANIWTPMAQTPETVKEGGALAYEGGEYIFALRGEEQNDFWRYSIASNTWTLMQDALENVKIGGALTFDGGNFLYAFRGNDWSDFWQYDIASNSWSPLAAAPQTVNDGGALTSDGGSYIYALLGGGTRSFCRYDIVGNSWILLADAPQNVMFGGAVAYGGGNYIYALRGGGERDFWRYDIAADSWAAMALAPELVKEGGALAYDGSSSLYAFRGDSTPDLWRYDIGANSWEILANAPDAVHWGGALSYRSEYLYQASGTIASQVFDTTIPGAIWNSLFWDDTIQLNTDITFEVRASDTPFLKDAATPSWIPVGGTSPVRSGLPSGRYMQWRATLSTSYGPNTPILHEVRLYYY